MSFFYYGFWSIAKKSLVQGYQDSPCIASLRSGSVLASSFICGKETRIGAGGQTLGNVSIIAATSLADPKGKESDRRILLTA